MQELIAHLFDRWKGQPILVIGGGPSARKDLPKLKAMGVEPKATISANDHGFKQDVFPIDLVVNCDVVHCLERKKMCEYLAPYAGKVVNRYSWADYRLADWKFSGNSGMTAIAVAAALGGHPVIVTGIDMWKGGRLYFHDQGTKPQKVRRVSGAVSRRDKERVRPLLSFCSGVNVRPVSGPLTEWFKPFDPAETFKPAVRPTGYRLRMEDECPETVYAEVVRAFRFQNHDYTRLGQVLALSTNEIQIPQIACNVRRVAKPV
jgi:hypothetical protein